MAREFMDEIGRGFIASAGAMAEDISLRFRQNEGTTYERIQESELHSHLSNLIEMIGNDLLTSEQGFNEVSAEKWGKDFGGKAVKSGVSVAKTMTILPYFRTVLFNYIRTAFENREGRLADYFQVADTVNPFIDRAVYAFTEAYVEHNNETFNHAKEELLELSVPVVPLTSDVAILPIIGTIDTRRSAELLDKSLNKGRELGLSYLIVDLSGVHMIDTAVAHNLFQLNDALSVVGITAVFSGLRPELAQTIVSLGISFKHMTVTSNLQRALELTGLVIEEGKTSKHPF
ncbi:STAS domain-containing protein [Salisediminibacterium halotolerans]|nr:STAS domain-containing protein [Salisediminibacterium haloalkalitolerans]